MAGKKVYSSEYIVENGDRFDFLKFILAIFIVAVHTVPMGLYVRPILRIAVPIFFIMSSYFFFIKQKKCDSFEARKQAMKGFAIRLLKLYLFWFIVLLPLTIYTNGWYENPGFGTFVDLIRGFLFGNTFRASWYIMALLLNILFVWYAFVRKVSDLVLFVLGILMYIGCCLVSSYYGLTASLSGFDEVYNGYVKIFAEPYNSFPCGLLFICIGKLMAENAIFVRKNVLLMLIAVFSVLYYFEFFVTNHYGLAEADDCFFTLPVVSTLCFMLVGQSSGWSGLAKLSARAARSCSTIIYCCHLSLASVIAIIGFHLGFGGYITEHYVWLFLLTLMASLLISFVIIRLEKSPRLKLLKYAH